MNLIDCAADIYKAINKKFSDKVSADEKNEFVSYQKLGEEEKEDKRKKLKKQIVDRLNVLFEELEEEKINDILCSFNENERNLFICLLKYIPLPEDINNNTDSKRPCQKVRRACWETIPIDDRKKILKSVKKLFDEKNTISRYLDTVYKDKETIEEKYDDIKFKILKPVRYRLYRNTVELVKFLINEDGKIDFELDKEIIFFETKFDKLLRKCYKDDDKHLNGFARNHTDIQRELAKLDEQTVTNEDFIKQIEEAINQKRI